VLLSLSTMFMHLNLYIHNILLSVMVIDHSVMQSFSIDEKKLAWPRFLRERKIAWLIENFILWCSAAGANMQGKDFCCSVLSNDSKPVYLISLFQFDFYWISLTTSFVTNYSCSHSTNTKKGNLCNWRINSFKFLLKLTRSKRAQFLYENKNIFTNCTFGQDHSVSKSKLINK